MNEPIQILEYDPRWPDTFAAIRDRVAGVLGPLAQRIEHVGSTAVPGLPAKPIIDVDVVVTAGDLAAVIGRLRPLGYEHEGDVGVPGRDAFTTPPDAAPHHLYVCAVDSPQLARHLAFRDYLRAHPDTAHAYGELKRSIAQRVSGDRTAYGEAKTMFVEQVLAAASRSFLPRTEYQ